jgi:predicted aspartyl protease
MDKRGEAIFLLVMTGLLLMPVPAAGDIYQYEDDRGTVHFVDDPGKIPPKYQKRQRTRDVDMGDSEGQVTRVTISGNRVLVPVTLCYRGKEEKAQFVLDTGASSSTISPRLAQMLSLDPADTRSGFARGVGGGVYAVRQARLDYLAVGPNRKYDVAVVVIESTQADGLLGMDFLRELRYHIDFHESTITWGN